MDIYRTYNTSTRSLTKRENAYAGQIGDSLSTTLHFEYDDLGYLSKNHLQAFIVFAVYDKNGDPLVYGPSSTPSFDGLTFDIPWDVTSRITSRRLEYQLWFISETVNWDGENWGALDNVQIIMSAVDGIAIKPSIGPKCGDRPFLPTATEPSILGWINLWQNVGLTVPVDQRIDEDGKFNIIFHTYSGNTEYKVVLDVPALDEDGHIPDGMLNLIRNLAETEPGEQNQIPTARATLDYLDENYTTKVMSITAWDSSTYYEIGSTVVYGASSNSPGIYIAEQPGISHEPTLGGSSPYWRYLSQSITSYISTLWPQDSASLSDTKVPSEKLTKTSLDALQDDIDTKVGAVEDDLEEAVNAINQQLSLKVNSSQISESWAETGTSRIPNTTMVQNALNDKVDASKISNTLVDSSQYIPSGHAVSEALNAKTDVLEAVPVWSEQVTYRLDSTVIYSGKLFISRADNNLNHDPLDDVTHTFWDEISGSGGGGGGGGGSNINAKSIQFGDLSHSTYEVIHNLGTYNIIYSIRETSYPRDYVSASVSAVDRSRVRISLTRPPGENALTFNVIAVTAPSYPTSVEVVDITSASTTWSYANSTGAPVLAQAFDDTGDEITGVITQNRNTSYTPVTVQFQESLTGELIVVKGGQTHSFTDQDVLIINHNMATFVAVQTFADNGQEIIGTVRQNGSNTAVVDFGSATSGYAVVAPATNVEEFPNAASTWTYTHNLGRTVMIKLLDENKQYIGADMVQSISQSGGTITVTFGQTMAGYMLIF